MEFIKNILPYISYLWIVIVVLAIWAWVYVNRLKNSPDLMAKRHWIEMMPSAISTLGVLGTFLGITLGLLCFDTSDLKESIPELLSGLKTAFFTSLAGMIGSLILSKKINNVYDEATGGVSDINQAAGVICKSVSDFQSSALQQSQSQQVFYNLMQTVIQQMDANISSMNANVNSLNVAASNMALAIDHIANSVSHVEESSNATASHASSIADSTSSVASSSTAIATAATASAATMVLLKNTAENIDGTTGSIVSSVGNIEEISRERASVEEQMNSRIGEMVDHTEAMVSTESEVSEKVTTLTDRLHGEVVEIEDKMAEANALLEKKFDEFSELLKKNNTEALVEVMKRVTEEFQTQMNALISKLVQENFDQLNKSVEKLNQWQVENKEMIASLTSQYRQMADNFEDTSTSLTKVKQDTQELVSDGGKLEQLINSLNEVIVRDEKFKEISTNLQKTADLSKSNMESFDQSTRQLNEWVRKQRGFSDSVAVLIQKLEEINEMKNYASQFWQETKQGMNDAVGIIRNGTTQLNQQVTGLDQQFYARLSTTLAQLDACIQALITNAPNHR